MKKEGEKKEWYIVLVDRVEEQAVYILEHRNERKDLLHERMVGIEELLGLLERSLLEVTAKKLIRKRFKAIRKKLPFRQSRLRDYCSEIVRSMK